MENSERIIDVHMHVGHRFEWTQRAREVWMDTGPYVPRLFDESGSQIPEEYGRAIKEEVWGGILIPEYSPKTAGVMPFERAEAINRLHPELIPIAGINPNVHEDVMASLEGQLARGARAVKIHPIHGFFYANDERLYPVYERCSREGLVVMFHAGTSMFPGCKMRFADPYTFDDVISDFPDLRVVLCHGGRGFWYHIAEFMVRRFENVYIDVSGLPPAKLLEYFPSMARNSRKFLFGSDFPGVPGISRNCRVLRDLVRDETAFRNITFQNAYDLFGFWKEGLFEVTNPDEIGGVVNDGARRYQGAIPADCWHEPYMPAGEVTAEMKRMRFYGFRKDTELLGVMGKERILDTTLVRHAYVVMKSQRQGVGTSLLRFIEKQVETEWLLIGTWSAATWAIDFYRKHGYDLMDNKDELLRRYWDISDRQIETSVVLGKRMR
jgi:predicted TIM-barrel fold metal-dependent hydrolase/GNAT superfamily N-acetyltransferase